MQSFPLQRFTIKFMALYLAALACWSLQHDVGLSAAFSAALVGAFGTFIPVQGQIEKSGVEAAIYAGAFAGMCSPHIMDGHPVILIISLIATSFYLITKPHMKGFGGKLGTIAFLACLIYFSGKTLWASLS